MESANSMVAALLDRERGGMTQQQIADRIGVTQATVSKVLKGSDVLGATYIKLRALYEEVFGAERPPAPAEPAHQSTQSSAAQSSSSHLVTSPSERAASRPSPSPRSATAESARTIESDHLSALELLAKKGLERAGAPSVFGEIDA